MVLVNRSALEIFYQLNKSKQAAETVDNNKKKKFKFKTWHTLPQGLPICVVYPAFPTKVPHFILLDSNHHT